MILQVGLVCVGTEHALLYPGTGDRNRCQCGDYYFTIDKNGDLLPEKAAE